jgi:signal transduction histidine kinase
VNARSLHERNTVMNRILRHNLRNDINVIQGSIKLIRDRKGDPVKHAERISGKVDELMKVSEQVRRIQETNDPDRVAPKPVDVVGVVEERLTLLERNHPEVTVTKSLPEEAIVYADQLLDAILDNVFENAIEHNEGQPRVSVEVSRNEVDGVVEILVSDNGPGVPGSELKVLDEGRETPLEHSTGTGLWLVKWYVEQNGGRLNISSTEAGTDVEIDLPGVHRRPPKGGLLQWTRWFVRLTRV